MCGGVRENGGVITFSAGCGLAQNAIFKKVLLKQYVKDYYYNFFGFSDAPRSRSGGIRPPRRVRVPVRNYRKKRL
jgi:hypothetical protein